MTPTSDRLIATCTLRPAAFFVFIFYTILFPRMAEVTFLIDTLFCMEMAKKKPEKEKDGKKSSGNFHWS